MACASTDKDISYSLRESPSIHVSKGNLGERSYAYIFSEDLPILSKCNQILIKMNEEDLIKYLFKHDNKMKMNNHTYSENAEKMSNLEKIAFFLLLEHCFIAFLVLCAEILIFKLKSRRNKCTMKRKIGCSSRCIF